MVDRSSFSFEFKTLAMTDDDVDMLDASLGRADHKLAKTFVRWESGEM